MALGNLLRKVPMNEEKWARGVPGGLVLDGANRHVTSQTASPSQLANHC